ELGIATPKVLAITLLTSMGPDELDDVGLPGTPDANVLRLAAVAHRARSAGVVCSVAEVAAVKTRFGSEFLALCPGIRPAGSAYGDQRRVATPRDARDAG